MPTLPLTAILRPSAAPVAPTVAAMVPKAVRQTAKVTDPAPAHASATKVTEASTIAAAPVSTAGAAPRSEAPATAMAATALSPSAPPASNGVDADGLRSYRLALAREARRHKRYPSQAIDAGWGGTAEVRVSVPAVGAVQVAELTKSSGHPLLDEAALEMLRQAAPATPVPAALRGRAFAVNLPVVFELPE